MKWGAIFSVVIFVPIVIWYVMTPRATLHFPKSGSAEIRYQWNTHDRIYRSTLFPGELAVEPGELFPREGFFMVVDWWVNRGSRQCVKVIPTWYGTDIYLDANGNIDLSPEGGTDLSRVMNCTNRPEEDISCRPC